MPEAHVKFDHMAGISLEPSPLLMEKCGGLDNQQERLTNDLHWLAGIIEGEGCFTLSVKNRYGKHNRAYFPMIQITNTNTDMIVKIKEILSEIRIAYYFYAQLPKKGNPYFRVEIGGLKRVKRFLDLMIPCFRCRNKQARVLLEYSNLRLSKATNYPLGQQEDDIANKLYELNGKHKNSSLSSETTRRTELVKSDDIVRPFVKA